MASTLIASLLLIAMASNPVAMASHRNSQLRARRAMDWTKLEIAFTLLCVTTFALLNTQKESPKSRGMKNCKEDDQDVENKFREKKLCEKSDMKTNEVGQRTKQQNDK